MSMVGNIYMALCYYNTQGDSEDRGSIIITHYHQ